MAFVQELKSRFDNIIRRDALGHAYIFFGQSMGRNLDFIASLTRRVETGAWENSTPLIDSFFLGLGDAGSSAGIDSIRLLREFLWQKPLKSPRKIAVIPYGHRMTLPAQQAFLKIAEEPPESALIILNLPDPSVLFSTLVSRFQKIFVSGPAELQLGAEYGVLAKSFLGADSKVRKEILKTMIEEERSLMDFGQAIYEIMARNVLGYRFALKRLSSRLALMNQYNTNKRLQLEAALLEVKLL